MTLDEIPQISRDVYETHKSRVRNRAEYNKWMQEIFDELRFNNRALYAIIEGNASGSQDSNMVKYVAYAVLSLVNHQLEADRMERDENGGKDEHN